MVSDLPSISHLLLLLVPPEAGPGRLLSVHGAEARHTGAGAEAEAAAGARPTERGLRQSGRRQQVARRARGHGCVAAWRAAGSLARRVAVALARAAAGGAAGRLARRVAAVQHGRVAREPASALLPQPTAPHVHLFSPARRRRQALGVPLAPQPVLAHLRATMQA